MNLKWKLILRAGVTWTIIGIILMILVALLQPFLSSFGVEGLSVWSYAAMFAGVHYSIRSGKGWLEAMLGGALSGLITGALIILAEMLLGSVLPIDSAGGFNIITLVGAFIAGLVGGLGTKLSQRF